MIKSLEEYYEIALKQLNFAYIPELSYPYDSTYKMFPQYGEGFLRKINWNNLFFILIADFTPKENFVRISEISQNYLEISQFETDSSSFKIKGKKLNLVERGICYYINTSKLVYAYCDVGKPARFTKILITEDYYHNFLNHEYLKDYKNHKDAFHFLSQNPNIPELNFIFQQIRDCQAKGTSQQLYFESKILEILSLITHNLEQRQYQESLSVKLDNKDLRYLKKVVNFMKKNLSSYPSIVELGKIANMSTTRFQMAFKQIYGATAYDYLREMRMNYALLLLKDSDYSIKNIAAKVGYNNAGHFAGIFKKTYGIGPKNYRNIHRIK
ncbi:AraC family transcriptional regulator [Clostridium kluyveri]|uniref:AraC family transcriptional regulator n=1 Tax=Clostridium kluyveri TaxID=1534 RepID=UPI0022477144|nr:AraC family transcriptional regulator [Clostridium kluyveri]UZQ51225.1 AraC family transcriptional regulator [Clostridium kluyveri]